MKNTKHYFKLAFSSHHAENITFLIDCNRDPWRLFERRMDAPDTNWKEVACDSERLKTYLSETAKPETWEDMYARPRTIDMMLYSYDGAMMEAEWDFGKGIINRSYGSYERHETEMVGVEESSEMFKWFKDSLKRS